MIALIDDHREMWGVELICAVLPIAPPTYYQHKAWDADQTSRPDRQKMDDGFRTEIKRVWQENHEVYGTKKVWIQLKREGIAVARCTV
jgi:putative transposase